MTIFTLKSIIAAAIINSFYCLPLSAQERKWGIGLTLNSSLFAHANNSIYVNSDFKPVLGNSLGLNFKREFGSAGRFKTQISLHILKKKVGLGFSEKSGATTYRETISYEFFSTDFGVNVLYENPEWRHNFRPFVGLSFSSAYFYQTKFKQGSRVSGASQGFGIIADTPDSLRKWVFYPYINLGVSKPFAFYEDGKQWEMTLAVQLSPVQSFQNLYVMPPTGNIAKLLRGHFHHITFALNRFF